MPTPLNTIDLASATVGGTGKIDLSKCAPTANPAFTNKNATLVLYNESGAGLRLAGIDTGLAADLPAGGWLPLAVPVAETSITYTVVYLLSNPLVSTLLATYYIPGEPVPTLASLGNSPVGLSSNVANQVINSGNAAPSVVVLGTPASSATELELNNDGSGFVAGGRIVYTAAGAPETTNVDTTSFNQELAGYHTARAGGVTDWQLVMAASARSELQWVSKGSPDIVALKISNLGQQIDNGQATTDGFGNWSATSYLTIGGKQETGGAGVQSVPATAGGQVAGMMTNFKTVMTNTPSSVTLSLITNSNAGAAVANNISKTRFFYSVASSAAGAFYSLSDYTTVGN